jgi:hypothetical protein
MAGGTVTLNSDTLPQDVAQGGVGGSGDLGGALTGAGVGGNGGNGSGGGLYVAGGSLSETGDTLSTETAQGGAGGNGNGGADFGSFVDHMRPVELTQAPSSRILPKYCHRTD